MPVLTDVKAATTEVRSWVLLALGALSAFTIPKFVVYLWHSWTTSRRLPATLARMEGLERQVLPRLLSLDDDGSIQGKGKATITDLGKSITGIIHDIGVIQRRDKRGWSPQPERKDAISKVWATVEMIDKTLNELDEVRLGIRNPPHVARTALIGGGSNDPRDPGDSGSAPTTIRRNSSSTHGSGRGSTRPSGPNNTPGSTHGSGRGSTRPSGPNNTPGSTRDIIPSGPNNTPGSGRGSTGSSGRNNTGGNGRSNTGSNGHSDTGGSGPNNIGGNTSNGTRRIEEVPTRPHKPTIRKRIWRKVRKVVS